MEKSTHEKKDISYVLDIRTIPADGLYLNLEANPTECSFLAKRYDLLAVHSLCAAVKVSYQRDLVEVKGSLIACIKQRCVVSLEEFDQEVKESFTALFSDNKNIVAAQEAKMDFDPEEEPIEFIQKGRIYFKELIAEHFGLFIDPFPKKTNKLFTYYEEKADDKKENPFSVLKHLTKS